MKIALPIFHRRNSGSFFEKRDMMLTLIFLRFIGEKFDDGIEKLKNDLTKRWSRNWQKSKIAAAP